MAFKVRSWRTALMAGCAGVALGTALPAVAAAEGPPREYSIASQELGDALRAFAMTSGHDVVFDPAIVRGRMTPGVQGSMSDEDALRTLLQGADLAFEQTASGGFVVRAPRFRAAEAEAEGGTVEALIVTAQKREEDIQDVPIAISAFTQEQLERSQVAGGPDLMTQVPNMTFTKTNFSSYSIQLRGIGTQAISATVDPAVAVAFNNTPFIRNRFFEQEFYDLQRVEVLRGPQGTLYGRNATAGVVNLISQKARLDTYEAKLSGDIANYNSTRLEGMVNIPLANDVAALRIAGAWTKREGYSINDFDGEPIDGRDLWSTRVSLRFAPTDRLDANLIWEHFQEDDDRMRSGKQLCQSDIVTEVAGIPTEFYGRLTEQGQARIFSGVQASFSQGCLPGSLYSPDAFGKPNALMLPYYLPLGDVFLPTAPATPGGDPGVIPADPYASRTQSTDLRVIEATVAPSYRAKTDIAELQVQFDLTDTLTLASETAWSSDFVFGSQDYNRFIGAPQAWVTDPSTPFRDYVTRYLNRGILRPDGFFCDPQIGCSDRLIAMDLATSRSTQFSQELRLASDYEGAFNFSLGANFLRHDAEDKYYVFINSLTMLAAYHAGSENDKMTKPWVPGVTDNRECLPYGIAPPDFTKVQPILQCTYIDPNPIENLNDLGHNYFLSKNPYKLISYAVFGEAYYEIAENLKLTAGLRWTVDQKEAPLIPSWVFAANSAGHPIVEVVEQEWRKPTGRLALDWKPEFGFTDETMVYASYSHGYKAGGMNPPPYGKASYITFGEYGQNLAGSSTLHPKTFEPEYVDAFELGAKNTLLDGALTLNLAGFYYDYQGYQLSQIVNRSAVTANFDAEIWGVELESDWRPAENLRLGLKLGYENTKVGDGMQAIDVMDRTAGNDAWVISRPFPSVPSNCVLPAWLFIGNSPFLPGNPDLVNVGGKGGGGAGGCEQAYLINFDPATNAPYVFNPYSPAGDQTGEYFRSDVNYAAWSTDLADYPCLPAQITAIPAGVMDYPGVDPECLAALSNNGEGFYKDLSGNELPNAPNFTTTITADYTIPLPSAWLMTLHTDLYYQSEAWTRIFNTEGYDKLKAYTNVNLAAIFTNEDAGWKVMAYVKNVFDRDSITGAFLNSDDTGLTTNVFLTEPRLYGLRVTKEWNGGPWWTGANLNHAGPFPLTVELSGQIQRQDAPNEELTTDWAQTLPETVDPGNVQDRDLDWGDGRSVKLTWRPDGSPWSVSGAFRYGRTNTELTRIIKSSTDIAQVCGFQGDFGEFLCGMYPFIANLETINWADAESRSREEHQLVDFAVGYDVGIGGLVSTVSAGLRHADFQSDTTWKANTQSGWELAPGWAGGVPSSYFRRHASLDSTREFDGWGPTLSWDAGLELWEGADLGEVSLDWSVGAGVLFGKHTTAIAGQDEGVQHTGYISWGVENFPYSTTSYVLNPLPAVSTTTTPIAFNRSDDAAVPLVDLSLGISYDVGRVKVSTGYRWERYFDVLDTGFEEAEEADRTIDGPYFKIAVGFGG